MPYDGFGPSGMYRLVFPLTMGLGRQGGHEVTTPFFEKRQLPLKKGQDLAEETYEFSLFPLLSGQALPDVLVVQKPLIPELVVVARACQQYGVLVVGENDDSMEVPEWHPAFEATSKNRFLTKAFLRDCDAVTVTTEALADEHRGLNENVHVLPNFLLWEMWENTRVVPDDRLVRIGWMGRSHWRHGDLEVLKDVVPRILGEFPNAVFVAAGDRRVLEILNVPKHQGRVHAPVRFPRGLAALTASMDIGLVPLARQSDVERHFNDSKSYLKGLEYNACGIPYVASPSAPYRDYTRPGINGYLAETTDDWIHYLRHLILDAEHRREMGRQARELARQYSIEENWGLWRDLYESLLAGREAVAA